VLAKEIFLPLGDFEELTMETLKFAEFAEVFGKRELHDTIDMFGGADAE